MSDRAVFLWAQQYAEQFSVTALAKLTRRYDRSTISQYLSGTYPAGVNAIEEVLRSLMDSRCCPYLERDITAEDCLRRKSRPRPNYAGSDMEAHWEACQECLYNQETGKNLNKEAA